MWLSLMLQYQFAHANSLFHVDPSKVNITAIHLPYLMAMDLPLHHSHFGIYSYLINLEKIHIKTL